MANFSAAISARKKTRRIADTLLRILSPARLCLAVPSTKSCVATEATDSELVASARCALRGAVGIVPGRPLPRHARPGAGPGIGRVVRRQGQDARPRLHEERQPALHPQAGLQGLFFFQFTVTVIVPTCPTISVLEKTRTSQYTTKIVPKVTLKKLVHCMMQYLALIYCRHFMGKMTRTSVTSRSAVFSSIFLIMSHGSL